MDGLQCLHMLASKLVKYLRKLTSEHMAFQMFSMQVCLVAIWARKFAISILRWHRVVSFWRPVHGSGHDSSPSGCAR